jgi:trimeric autotransporter adhesin
MMKGNKDLKTKTNIIYSAFALLAFACLAVLPSALAVVPAPDGGYPGENTAEGDDALFSLTTGADNTATGEAALYSNTTGFENTAAGAFALFSNTTGFYNTALGGSVLLSNTTGNYNTATGLNALPFNTTGYDNTATGAFALFSNTTGSDNTAAGLFALFSSTSGHYNTAVGSQALFFNSGSDNTAGGAFALFSNHGNYNTATGYSSLYSNATGSDNTATGFNVLAFNTTGCQNTAAGFNALARNTIGSSNIALGYEAGVNLATGDNNIDIGNAGAASDSGVIRIGTTGTHATTFVAGIRGTPITGSVAVGITANGQLGVRASSARFKEAIKPMESASEAILSLQPVTFRYKKELDPEGIPQFGLVAEEVEKVNPDLVARDEQGKPYTVRYDQVNAMLLNEFLKEHRKVEDLTKDFQATVAQLTVQLTEQAAQIQKLNAHLKLGKRESQMAVINP